MLKIETGKKIIICLSIIFVLSGCGTERGQQDVISIEDHITFVNFENDPDPPHSLKIIHAYEGMADYAEAAQNAEREDIDDLYNTHVVNPHREACTVDGTYGAMEDSFVKNPTRKYDYLIDGADEIRESNIEQLIGQAIEDSSKLLFTPETTVCIFVIEPDATFVRDNMGGVTGFTIGANKIWVQIYPNSDWQNHLAYLVAHEYHHSVWFMRHFSDANDDIKNLDLLDRMLVEGKADAFAEMVYPDVEAPWAHALTEKQLAYQWERIQDELDASDDLTTGRWMFGYSGVSTWTGYALGFNIVQNYLDNHPDSTIDEWTALKAEEMLAKSNFDP